MMYENSEVVHVQISRDEMTAYLTLDEPEEGAYSREQLEYILVEKGVLFGVDKQILQRMIDEGSYYTQTAVAHGEVPVDGQDGFYEYNFKQNPNNKPVIREDGSVDYWSMNLIETVIAGQVIAIYKPAVQGKNGMTVTGKEIPCKIGKELSPIKGRGFERQNDNLTYIASIDGKIDMIEGKININNFHEIYGNVDFNFGNIDFAGDVVIHGNVCTGISVRAGGTITVDGVVEGAKLWAGKDIVLRSGVLGDGKADIFSRGNITAGFFEYAKIEALGDIQADYLLQCEAETKKKIRLEGRKGKILGGRVHAVCGIEANEIGNESELHTIVEAGIGDAVYKRMQDLRKELLTLHEDIDKISAGLKKMDELIEANGSFSREDPRRTQLVRARIQYISREKAGKAELRELNQQEEEAKEATIKVGRRIYPGVALVIGNVKKLVQEAQFAVEYVRMEDKIVLRGEQIVG